MALKKETQEEIDIEEQARIDKIKLQHHVTGIRERLARDLDISLEEISKKQIIIKGDSIVVK